MNELRQRITLYNLPENWEKKEIVSFDELAVTIGKLHSESQNSAIKAVNRLASVRNYLIGFYIVEYEQRGRDRASYGERLLKRLAESINIRGINETLLKVSRLFYLKYPQIKAFLLTGKSATPSHQFVSAAADIINNLSFSHIREIMTVEDPLARYFYEVECMKSCWSVKELRRQIASNLHIRIGLSEDKMKAMALVNANAEPQSPQLQLRDPYTFEFLGLQSKDVVMEGDIEEALVAHLQDFLLEMGNGLCFEARQKRIIIDDEYYYADLVFYNRLLHCNVIVELKNDEFRYEHIGQLNTYVSYYAENEMQPGDNPPVGILLCTRKGKKMVEYALAGMDNNLFVSTYMLTLPDSKRLEEFIIKETEGIASK